MQCWCECPQKVYSMDRMLKYMREHDSKQISNFIDHMLPSAFR